MKTLLDGDSENKIRLKSIKKNKKKQKHMVQPVSKTSKGLQGGDSLNFKDYPTSGFWFGLPVQPLAALV